jgi:hypothetical protein
MISMMAAVLAFMLPRPTRAMTIAALLTGADCTTAAGPAGPPIAPPPIRTHALMHAHVPGCPCVHIRAPSSSQTIQTSAETVL